MNLSFFDISHFSNGLLLLCISVMGNYASQTLGCQTQKLLENNMFVKKFVIFMIIYFTLNITNKEVVHPVEQLSLSFVLLIFFILFTKMNFTFTIIVFILLCTSYVIQNGISYYQQKNVNNQNGEIVNTLLNYNYILGLAINVITIIGVISYYLKEKKEKKQFSLYYFIFGKKVCDSFKLSRSYSPATH